MMLQSVLSNYTYGDSHSSHDIFEINIKKIIIVRENNTQAHSHGRNDIFAM